MIILAQLQNVIHQLQIVTIVCARCYNVRKLYIHGNLIKGDLTLEKRKCILV